MEFARANGKRVKPMPGLRGLCSVCDAELIPKCGTGRIWHWAHKGQRRCDHWWEAETEWHRTWKGYFPEAWREIVHISARTGEKHIADIKTPQGRIIEFQHSHISRQERAEREEFYQDLTWVVDGTRLQRDQGTFFSHLLPHKLKREDPESYQINSIVPQITKRWCDSEKNVVLDFCDGNVWLVNLAEPTWMTTVERLPKEDFVRGYLEDEVVIVKSGKVPF